MTVRRACALAAALALAAGCGDGSAPSGASTPGGDAAVASSGDGEAPWFVEEAATRGLRFEHRSGHAERYLMPEIMGGGAALFDMDADGDLDAYLVQSGSLTDEDPPGNRLFANEGDGRFADVTETSGAGDAGYGMGVAVGDADGDGDEDLFVTNHGPDTLLRNDGAGAFTDLVRAGADFGSRWSTSASFLDLERDGDLDLYVTTYLVWSLATEKNCNNTLGKRDYCDPQEYEAPERDFLWRNEGRGRFVDASTETGVAAHAGTGLGVGCADFDDDGWIDVFVANDGMPDFLWRNGRDGTLVESGETMGCAVDENGIHKAGMGVAIADVDLDGDPDLLVCNLNRESDSFFLNQGTYFTDRTSRAGLGAVSKPFTRFGLGLFDFDNDGLVDLYQANGRVNRLATRHADDPYAEPNLLFAGTEPARFREVEPRGGTSVPLIATSRAAAFGDVDGDGGLDVLVVNRDGPAHLLMNRAAQGRRWIAFDVRERTGAQAIGATVELRAGGGTRRADVRAASSYLASSDPRPRFGLAAATGVEGVVVRWPDGTRESFGDFEAGAVHPLTRGAGTPVD